MVVRRLVNEEALVRGANHDYLAWATLKSLPALDGTPFSRQFISRSRRGTEIQENETETVIVDH